MNYTLKGSLGPKMNILVLPEMSLQTLVVGSLTIACLLILFITVIIRKRSKSRGSLVLLVGAADAGKTSILSSMIYGQPLPTHTSLFVNSSIVTSQNSKKQLCIVDVPGYQRLRNAFKDHISDAKAVVFVVDASTVTRNGKGVAEFLHHVLHAITSLPPTHALPPVIILAHKADLITLPSSSNGSSQDRNALAVSRVRTCLERELESRRTAQASGIGIEGLGAEGESSDIDGLDCIGGGSFKFADWEGSEVSIVGSWVGKPQSNEQKSEKSISEGDDGLEDVRDWLDNLP